MAAKFHISENGMPGKCSAASPDSCPKTQAGDSFHGTLEQATQESQERFEKQLGAFVTASKKDEAKTYAGEEFARRFAATAQRAIDNPDYPQAQQELAAIRAEMEEEIRAGRGSYITGSKTYEDAEVALGEAQAGKSAAALREELKNFKADNPADDPTDLEVALADAEDREGDGSETYIHPQGKKIRINKDGSIEAFTADGRKASTSATAEKLRGGYGAWKRDENATAKPRLSLQEENDLVDAYDGYDHSIRVVEEELKTLHSRHRAYNSANAAAEGRAYYMGRRPDGTFGRVEGVNPKGQTYFTPSEVQASEVKYAQSRVANMKEAAAQAQTALEENGLGHRIPDEGNTVRVRTQAQKWLLEDELKGQISDGKWENSGGEAWQDWSTAKVVVDAENPGRNFNTSKDNYQLNAKDLLDVVGDRMVLNVQAKTGKADYSEKAMQADLKDLRDIFKTKRGRVTGD